MSVEQAKSILQRALDKDPAITPAMTLEAMRVIASLKAPA